MPVKGNPDPLNIGRGLASPGDDLKETLGAAALDKFDFVTIPLSAPGGQGKGAEFQPSVASDLVLSTSAWGAGVVGCVSEGLVPPAKGLGPAPDCGAQALETELRWAAHLGLHSVLLPPPGAAGFGYARAVNELLLSGCLDAGASEGQPMPLALRVSAGPSGWQNWNGFRTLCDYHCRLVVALEFGAEELGDDLEVKRWISEPVRFVLLSTSVFLQNKHGFPVLSKKHKGLLSELFRHPGVHVVISSPEGAANDDLSKHQNYVAQLFQSKPPLTQAEQFGLSHLDRLQAPLQPLADNLESQTYEVFERDPVKYAQYEEAIVRYLQDRVSAGRTAPCTIMVLGAGRGPLVQAALQAARRVEVEASVWAVEKNPNAVHTLRHRRRTEEAWASVTVVSADMRSWEAPHKADCIVSELLGSFGDNELSPECLDGAQRFLAEDGVSIPQRYVSCLHPVSAPKVWDEVRGHDDLEHFEMGYVVNVRQPFFFAGPAQDCFEFQHPNKALESNDRAADLVFNAEAEALMHGFVAYFDCDLYRGVCISIRPETFSTGMFSWFPMFFPLKTPILVRKGEAVHVHWWRRHDAKRVWYEWGLSQPSATAIQNPGGRSWEIGL